MNRQTEGCLLAAISLSHNARAVAVAAHQLAEKLGLELQCVHVGKDDGATRDALCGVLDLPRGSDLTPYVRIVSGRPASRICELAVELAAQIVVCGAYSAEGSIRYIWGSVGRDIARYAPCSVLLLPVSGGIAKPIRTIVVDVKYDSNGKSMVAYALDFARSVGATRLHAVHQYNMAATLGVGESLDSHSTGQKREAIREAEELRLQAFLEDVITSSTMIKSLSVEPYCLAGRDGWVCAQHARRYEAELLFFAASDVSMRKLGSFFARMFQPGHELILEHLPTAVLLYRAQHGETGESHAPSSRAAGAGRAI